MRSCDRNIGSQVRGLCSGIAASIGCLAQRENGRLTDSKDFLEEVIKRKHIGEKAPKLEKVNAWKTHLSSPYNIQVSGTLLRVIS